jgi:aldose sugar dehydrogenase
VKKNRIIFALILIGLTAVLTMYFFHFNQIPGNDIAEENSIEVVASGLDTPWGIDFLPDGTLIFTEREGIISMIKTGEVTKLISIAAKETGESGLSGIAVDPNFTENKFIYVYYTADTGNRVSKLILEGTSIAEEMILLDNIPSARHHDGGRIKFGPDGKLYVTTGDAGDPQLAQDASSLAGKILRMEKDGSIPADNPFSNYVYSLGHRNPQGLAWDEEGEMYSSEHGPTRNDEINVIHKGGNYGWPAECDEEVEFTNPIRCFSEFTLAPGSLAYFDNELYVSGLRGSQIRKLSIIGKGGDEDPRIADKGEIINDLGRLREVVVHEGFLYFSTSNKDGRGLPRGDDDKILRIKLE